MLHGCSFLKLKKELKVMESAISLEGTITCNESNNKPIIIALYTMRSNEIKVYDYQVHLEPGQYKFIAEADNYYLSAFLDLNNDLLFQSNEPAGFYGEPTLLITQPGQSLKNLNIEIVAPNPQAVKLYESSEVSLGNFIRNPGTIMQINDEQFTEDIGKLGKWEPLDFINKGYGGLFFLEPYDPKRIPILFVHGTGGYPQQWSSIIESLDNSKFQAWLFHYPSGLNMELVSEWLYSQIKILRARYEVEKLYIIGHSMGGMVSLKYIQKQSQSGHPPNIDLFVSISTPWTGSKAARIGTINPLAVVPSWKDIVPGSQFLEELLLNPMPKGTQYFLLFSYHGIPSPIFVNNDGRVSIVSQLDLRMQKKANKVYGFNEKHSGILKSKDLIKTLSEILDSP